MNRQRTSRSLARRKLAAGSDSGGSMLGGRGTRQGAGGRGQGSVASLQALPQPSPVSPLPPVELKEDF